MCGSGGGRRDSDHLAPRIAACACQVADARERRYHDAGIADYMFRIGLNKVGSSHVLLLSRVVHYTCGLRSCPGNRLSTRLCAAAWRGTLITRATPTVLLLVRAGGDGVAAVVTCDGRAGLRCSDDEPRSRKSAPLHLREARYRSGERARSARVCVCAARRRHQHARARTQGEEVTYDYNFRVEDGSEPCFCRAPSCRGALN